MSLVSNDYTSVINFALTLLSLSPVVIALPAIFTGILVNNKKIMGKYTYGRKRSIIYFLTIEIILVRGIIGILSS
ncbi:hypothetical protein [Sulfuracidifex tepidarius]|uniref:Uncharacterized protein n=1 Tax=Sulfuracidifex tepidarius TaxID=1294262 RepID=A0A510E622_9CREN|nr:hypothetical protein [Sulfuracidifex tepidarius]BBG25095.1 hypothetical protein IC006_2430 [Sulfuracidifex tepidarius]BBG27877.1 hypothetical protein IC007_2432 [Sulfuracidifex tepidarius]